MASEHIGIVSIAALIALLAYLKAFKKAKIPLFLYLALGFFIAGFLALYLSPGHAARASLKVFDGVYMSFSQLWDLNLFGKLKRVFQTMRNFTNKAYFIFVVLVFSLTFWRLSGLKIATLSDLKAHKSLCLAFFVGFLAVCSAMRGSLAVLQTPIAFLCLLLFILKERRSKSLLSWIFVANLAYLACMAATVQFPALPNRARLGDTMLAIALILLLLRYIGFPQCLKERARGHFRAILAVLLVSYGAWVLGAYVKFRLDWNAMLAYIKLEREAGRLDVVVDGRIFTSPYRNFGNWGDIGKNPNEWPNPTYARMFGLKSIRTK